MARLGQPAWDFCSAWTFSAVSRCGLRLAPCCCIACGICAVHWIGIDPSRYQTVAVKSMHHFRAAFEAIARRVVLVDTGALCSEIYTPELFSKARRPIYPLDKMA